MLVFTKRRSKLAKMMNEFYDAVYDIPKKNWGGCLFFCYVYLLMLEKYGLSTRRFHIVQYSAYNKKEILQNKKWLEGEEDFPTSSFHFTWVHNGLEMDSESQGRENILKGRYRGVLRGSANTLKDFIEVALDDHDDWNPSFDREDAIKKLESRLGIDLSAIPYESSEV